MRNLPATAPLPTPSLPQRAQLLTHLRSLITSSTLLFPILPHPRLIRSHHLNLPLPSMPLQ